MKILVILGLMALPVLGVEDLEHTNLKEVKQQVMPTEKESKWLDIPWRTDLTAALAEAAKEKKPIYLWEMDGHPLGCT